MGQDFNNTKLEYFDRIGIIKPIARLRREKVRDTFPKYEMMVTDIFTMKDYYYKSGLLQLHNDYEPWSNHKDEFEENTVLYYHPFQFLPMRRLMMGLSFNFSAESLEKLEDFEKSFRSMKDILESHVITSRKSYEEFWIPRIGLLILLDEPYGPYVKEFKSNPYIDSTTYYSEWQKWRSKIFNPRTVLDKCNLTVQQVKEFYNSVAIEGYSMDPLSNWFILQRIVNDSSLFRLKDNALYAQYCYKLAWMLAHFIYDLTGEIMFEPDDIMDGNRHGEWKKKVYSDPFDYTTMKIRQSILDTFLITRPFRAGIIFEGATENLVIESIIKALRVNKERDGFFLYNAKGQSKIAYNLQALYYISRIEDIELFLILDNDNDARGILDELKMYVKTDNVKIWQRDFEYDNFGVDRVADEVNLMLKSKGFNAIPKEQITNELNASNNTLMNVMARIFRDQHETKFHEVISKRTLAEKLFNERSAEIESERFGGDGWKPQLPIEIFLNEIFHKIPKHSFSYTFGC
jgi:hypothetical protein